METIGYVVIFGSMLLTLAAFANFAWWGLRLMRVLRERYPATWAEITMLWGMPGMNNPFRSIPWFLGPDYCGDEEVRRLKKATIWSTLLCVALLAAMPGVITVTCIGVAILTRLFEGS